MSKENNSQRSSQFQALADALKNRKMALPDLSNFMAIMNQNTMRKFNEAVVPKTIKGHRIDFNFNSVDMTSSNFVQDDKVYLVPKYTNKAFSESKLVVDFKDTPDGFDREIEQRIWSRIAGAFGLSPNLFSDTLDHSNDWKRQKDESFSDWGIRLEKLGLIDDQIYRQAYQQAVLTAVITSPIRFVKWLFKLRIVSKGSK